MVTIFSCNKHNHINLSRRNLLKERSSLLWAFISLAIFLRNLDAHALRVVRTVIFLHSIGCFWFWKCKLIVKTSREACFKSFIPWKFRPQQAGKSTKSSVFDNLTRLVWDFYSIARAFKFSQFSFRVNPCYRWRSFSAFQKRPRGKRDSLQNSGHTHPHTTIFLIYLPLVSV